MTSGVTWRLASAPPPAGLAVLELRGESGVALDALLEDLGLWVRPGSARLCDLLGVDEGLVVRWSDVEAHLTPHGGSAVIAAICERLTRRGVGPRAVRHVEVREDDPASVRRAALVALSVARSPMAVDLLLDQERRWEEGGGVHPRGDVLDRLVHPPRVVAMGPPNVGKSTLANALAGRSVSITGDAPGVTRDYVGVWIDLGGLVVRYVDLPGLAGKPEAAGSGEAAPGRIDESAWSAARALALTADLVLLCGDGGAAPPESPLPVDRTRSVALRADRHSKGWVPDWRCDVVVSAHEGRGLADLVRVLREALVPAAVLRDPRPWCFWRSLGGPRGSAPV